MIAWAFAASLAFAQSTPIVIGTLDNLDFEQGEVGKAPPGWAGKGVTSSDRPQAGLKDLLLHNDVAHFASFEKDISAAPYRGRTIRFRAAVRTDSSDGAGLWLRVDGKDKMLSLDNMMNRRVRSRDWTFVEIEAGVPQEAETIALGGIIYAAGEAGFDSASLSVATEAETPQAKAYLDRALDLLQQRHINKKQVDWQVLRDGAVTRAANAQTPSDTYAAIRWVIAQLKEPHTFLLPPHADVTAVAPGFSPIPLEVKSLGSRVAVLRLPGINYPPQSPEAAQYAAKLHEGIAVQQRAEACGWIVDLREDTGGDTYPMLDGLAPLLGPQPWTGFEDSDGRLSTLGLVGDRISETPVQSWPAAPQPTQLAPVAVLLGPHTASAGENTAIAFIGRPNSRSFGAPTAGYTTGNAAVPLSDGAILVLTGTYDLDRFGKRAQGALKPDQATAVDQATPVDQAENAALAWLAGKGCR